MLKKLSENIPIWYYVYYYTTLGKNLQVLQILGKPMILWIMSLLIIHLIIKDFHHKYIFYLYIFVTVYKIIFQKSVNLNELTVEKIDYLSVLHNITFS